MKTKIAKKIINDLDYEINNFNNIIQVLLSAFRNMEDDSETSGQVVTLLEVLETKSQKFYDQTMALWNIIAGQNA